MWDLPLREVQENILGDLILVTGGGQLRILAFPTSRQVVPVQPLLILIVDILRVLGIERIVVGVGTEEIDGDL